MSSLKYGWAAAVVAAGALIAGCGSSNTSTATASPPSATDGATDGGGTASATSATTSASAAPSSPGSSVTQSPVRLPRNASDYSQLLIDAWARGDRTAAARVATPAAVAATFAHAPVRDLVNYSCEERNPVVCGYIGDNEMRVEVSLDERRVARGAEQAITRVRLAKP